MSASTESWAAAARCIAKARIAPSRCRRRIWRHSRASHSTAMRTTTNASYLDWNATAPVRPEAAAAVARALTTVGNPSSIHRVGREAKRVLNDARDAVAALVNARAGEIVFTGGGTEANATALAGFP